MRFEQDTFFFVKNRNKYDLALTPIDLLTSNDFTFVVKCKPDWDSIPDDSTTAVVAKNGKHIGILAKKFTSPADGVQYFIGLTGWTKVKGMDEEIAFDYDIIVDKDEDEYIIAFVHNVKDNEITMWVNGKEIKQKYKGTIVDYSNAWIWIGCGCGFSDFPLEHQWQFIGDINFVGIYKKTLDKKDIDKIIDDKILTEATDRKHKPACVTNFSNKTPYKIKDESGMGHNLIVGGYEWT